MKKMQFVFVSALIAGGTLGAQTAPAPPPNVERHLSIVTSEAGAPGGFAGDRAVVYSGEFSFDGGVVKGQPYTADAVTETTQTLADGNHIVRKTTSSVARDSEGRTRREDTIGSIGPWSTAGENKKIVFINDPVAQVNYVLEPDHTARKMPLPGKGGEGMMRMKMKMDTEKMATAGGVSTVSSGNVFFAQAGKLEAGAEKRESLGTQTIEGVSAEGTRTTSTIPAGQIGNEQPITTTFERWYSPELQTVVMTKHVDPRMGETVYHLSNVVRAEPDAALFQVPSDYTVNDMKGEVLKTVRVEKQ